MKDKYKYSNSVVIMSNQDQNLIKKILRDTQSGNLSPLKQYKESHPDFHWNQLRNEKSGDTILHYAARNNHQDTLKYLLTQGNFSHLHPDIKNNDFKTPLHEAAQFSNFQCVEILIDAGTDVNALKRADWSPLMLACTKSGLASLKTVNLLLERGAFVNLKNKDGWSVLHIVARTGDLKIFRSLLNYNLRCKIYTNNGRSALHIACLHGHLEFAKLLLNLGLLLDMGDFCGNTPLHEAVIGGHFDLFIFLLDQRAEFHQNNKADFSILHLAASVGNQQLVTFIVNYLNFNVNLKNSSGFTPLHCAARKKDKKMYKILKDLGAEENLKDNFDRIPLDYF